MTTDYYEEAIRKADKLYLSACSYRDKYGYRENLGYDWLNRLIDYMSSFPLSYSEKTEIEQYYTSRCDTI